jgi:hypothetical protein
MKLTIKLNIKNILNYDLRLNNYFNKIKSNSFLKIIHFYFYFFILLLFLFSIIKFSFVKNLNLKQDFIEMKV